MCVCVCVCVCFGLGFLVVLFFWLFCFFGCVCVCVFFFFVCLFSFLFCFLFCFFFLIFFFPAHKHLRLPNHSGVYALLDLCGEHEMSLLHAALDDTGKLLFKQLHENYTNFHKFTGRV